MSEEVNLESRVYGEFPGLIFTDLEGNRVPVQTIKLDTNYEIESLMDFYEEEVDVDTTKFQKFVLDVPGLGQILPGTRVVWKEKDYVLLFGWHRNISNQEIYSWYLKAINEVCPDKTLYKWMINEIELVHFR